MHGVRLVQCCTDHIVMLDSAVVGVLIRRCHVRGSLASFEG